MKKVERDERLLAACLLSAVGGFTDVYSYLFRGGVFANAVTGNLVILGLRLATGDVRTGHFSRPCTASKNHIEDIWYNAPLSRSRSHNAT